MTLIKSRQTEFISEPETITEDIVQHYCRHTKELANSQIKKALQFIKHDCINYLGKAFENNEEFKRLKTYYPEAKHIFVCLPLNKAEGHGFLGVNLAKKPYDKDYNFSEYIIYKKQDGTFVCNCQGWTSKEKRGEIIKEGANCSHVLALYYAFKLKRFGTLSPSFPMEMEKSN
ncbi:hypothetical protein A3K64_00030 [Candidatus Micrarchaeota archaeon RBG_16_36_9]|nr:MAG: hypothetical protein A3K64_00030 [Candidatus Micrarchaeota archaeon RBG_16_36_9]